MKKIIFVLMLATVLISLPNRQANAEVDTNFYAKVEREGVEFCSMPDENYGLFILPSSYFVKVDYVAGDFYKVKYLDAEGYVKKSDVSLMQGVPIRPYFDATYKVFTSYALFKEPNENEVEATLSKQTEIAYYGKKTGTLGTDENDVWFYSSVVEDNEQKFGYVFSQAAFSQPEKNKPINNERFDIVSEDLLMPSTKSFTSLSTGTKIMLIVAISVPSILILYFLIKPTKILQTAKSKKKPKQTPRKVRHGDYFEFDESDL